MESHRTSVESSRQRHERPSWAVDLATFPKTRGLPRGPLFDDGPFSAAPSESARERERNSNRIDYYLFGEGAPPRASDAFLKLIEILATKGVGGVRLVEAGGREPRNPELALWGDERRRHGTHTGAAKMVQRAWVVLALLYVALPCPPPEVADSFRRYLLRHRGWVPGEGEARKRMLARGDLDLLGDLAEVWDRLGRPPGGGPQPSRPYTGLPRDSMLPGRWERKGGFTARDIQTFAGAPNSRARHEIVERLLSLGVIKRVSEKGEQPRYRYCPFFAFPPYGRGRRGVGERVYRARLADYFERASRVVSEARRDVTSRSPYSDPKLYIGVLSHSGIPRAAADFFAELSYLIPDLLAEAWVGDHPEWRTGFSNHQLRVDRRIERLRQRARGWMRMQPRVNDDSHFLLPIADVAELARYLTRSRVLHPTMPHAVVQLRRYVPLLPRGP
ncbi:MAG: hypothetical protein M1126_01830 [Candidatus Thermoplasmatota archaeon]|nr:hypothetical protein [Candidatus Thermoplasmatota archaeon]